MVSLKNCPASRINAYYVSRLFKSEVDTFPDGIINVHWIVGDCFFDKVRLTISVDERVTHDRGTSRTYLFALDLRIFTVALVNKVQKRYLIHVHLFEFRRSLTGWSECDSVPDFLPISDGNPLYICVR